jgi:superfamily II DNA/RNA helicase
MPPEITRLTEAFLHNPVRVEVSRAASTAEGIAQMLVRSGATPEEKRTTLRRIIRSAENFKNALIFCNRKRDVQVVYRSLEKHGFSVGALHGDLDQRSRMAALDAFRNDSVQLLVCSDVAARGLDIPDVSHVINYDAPHHSEDYVHRIGRTGRAGKLGVAVTIVTRADARSIDEIEKLTAQKIEWQVGGDVPVDEPAEADEAPREHRGGRSRRSGGDRGRGVHSHPESAQREARGGEHDRGGRSHGEPAAREGRSGAERVRNDRLQPAPAEREAARNPQPRPEEPRRQPKPEAPRRPRRDDEGDARVIGLGDHVPSFLLRPVRLPTKPIPAEAED